MSDWKIAMLALLPIFWAQGLLWRVPKHKIRCWLAMFGASMAAMLVHGDTLPIASYIVIDTVAGIIVLASPAGKAQKAIGFFFLCMVLFHIGFSFSGINVDAYLDYQTMAGWAQYLILAFWSVLDVGKYLNHHFGFFWPFHTRESAAGPDR